LALALALSFGLTTSMEAKPKDGILRGKAATKASKKANKKAQKASSRATKRASKQSRAARVKPRKAPKHRA
jgi:hypothetical protein